MRFNRIPLSLALVVLVLATVFVQDVTAKHHKKLAKMAILGLAMAPRIIPIPIPISHGHHEHHYDVGHYGHGFHGGFGGLGYGGLGYGGFGGGGWW